MNQQVISAHDSLVQYALYSHRWIVIEVIEVIDLRKEELTNCD